MKKLLFILLLLPSMLHPEAGNDFQSTLTESKMKFAQPADFDPVPVKANRHVLYQYALKHRVKKLEIRYSIWPLGKRLAEFRKTPKEPGTVMLDPNSAYQTFSMALAMNIASNGRLLSNAEFRPEDAAREFGAGWGGSTFVECPSGFGEGYRYAMILALHKDDAADAYIIYLFDDAKEVQQEMMAVFYCLQYQ
jgi:hypothetical protein